MKKPKPTLHNLRNSEGLTLFLDRDGVINTRLVDDYVKCIADFKFTEGFREALAKISGLFRYIVVVTNQQGIGKGLMTHETLYDIHRHMTEELSAAGGRVDKVYYCPDLMGSGSRNRKPEVGMALQAKRDLPDINFRLSVMVGDSESDLKFGRRLKMTTVYIDNGNTAPLPDHLADYRFKTFADFAGWVVS